MSNLVSVECKGFSGFVENSIKDFIENWLTSSKQNGLLRDTTSRSVWQIPFGNGFVFIKKFKYAGFFRIIGRTFFSNARCEFKSLSELAKRGLLVPKPLGILEERKGIFLKSSYLVTEGIENSRTLRDFLFNSVFTRSQKIYLLEKLAKFIRSIISVGFLDTDLHAGNVLIQKKDNDVNFYLIDVHRGRFIKNWSYKHTLKIISLFLSSMQVFFELSDLFRFLRYYAELESGDFKNERFRKFVNNVNREIIIHRWNYYRAREKKCLSRNNEFDIRHSGNYKIFIRRNDANIALIQKAIDSHRNFTNVPFKKSRNRVLSVYNDRIFVKEYKYSNIFRRLGGIFGWSRGRHSWFSNNAVLSRGINTPIPYALYEGNESNYLVGEWLNGTCSLNNFVKKYYQVISFSERCEFIWKLAMFIGKMHNTGIFHKDLKASNILVRHINDEVKFFIVDFDGIVLFKNCIEVRHYIKNFVQLNSSIDTLVTIQDKFRFFKYYSSINPSFAKSMNIRIILSKIMKMTISKNIHNKNATHKSSD